MEPEDKAADELIGELLEELELDDWEVEEIRYALKFAFLRGQKFAYGDIGKAVNAISVPQ